MINPRVTSRSPYIRGTVGTDHTKSHVTVVAVLAVPLLTLALGILAGCGSPASDSPTKPPSSPVHTNQSSPKSQDSEIKLPVIADGEKFRASDEARSLLVISVNKEGECFHFNLLKDLQRFLKAEARSQRISMGLKADSDIPCTVVIRADRELPSAKFFSVLTAFQQNGYRRLALMVYSQEPPPSVQNPTRFELPPAESQLPVQLAAKDGSAVPLPTTPLVITVTAGHAETDSGKIAQLTLTTRLGTTKTGTDLKALDARLAKKLQEVQGEFPDVIIQADRNLKYGELVKVIAVCTKQDVPDFNNPGAFKKLSRLDFVESVPPESN